MRHSHGRNSGPIFLKITDKLQLSIQMFGTEIQQDR